MESKVVILLLAAQPRDASPIDLDEEVRSIEQALRSSELRDRIRFEARWATRPDDLLEAFNRFRPSFVQFSAHGSESHLYLNASDGGAWGAPAPVLERLFETVGSDVKGVLLNACFSAEQASKITSHVDFAVGMEGRVSVEGALKFSTGFYGALAYGKSFREAFEQGRLALDLRHTVDEDKPRMFVGQGVDAGTLRLIDDEGVARNEGSPVDDAGVRGIEGRANDSGITPATTRVSRLMILEVAFVAALLFTGAVTFIVSYASLGGGEAPVGERARTVPEPESDQGESHTVAVPPVAGESIEPTETREPVPTENRGVVLRVTGSPGASFVKQALRPAMVASGRDWVARDRGADLAIELTLGTGAGEDNHLQMKTCKATAGYRVLQGGGEVAEGSAETTGAGFDQAVACDNAVSKLSQRLAYTLSPHILRSGSS